MADSDSQLFLYTTPGETRHRTPQDAVGICQRTTLGANWAGDFLPLIPQVASSDGLLSREKTALPEFLPFDNHIMIIHHSCIIYVSFGYPRCAHAPVPPAMSETAALASGLRTAGCGR